MDTSSEQKHKSGWSSLEIGLAVILACLVCILLVFAGRGLLGARTAGTSSEALPKHTVNDYQENGTGTSFLYVIVADKSLAEEDADKIISYYESKHPGYKIMNIWIFCDSTYATTKYVNGVQYSDSPYLSHVMYWLMASKQGKGERWFYSGPDADFPAFRSACK